jgi:hypothetical protein
MYNFILGCLFTYSSILTLEIYMNRRSIERRIDKSRSRRHHPTYKNVINL